MKRGAKLAVLLAALLVLVGAWLLAESLSGRRQTQLAEDAHAELTDISVGEAEDVTAMSWNYFGSTVSLRRENGAWINADDETCPIDSEAVEPLAEAVASAQAEQAIENVTDFDQYGLADPAIVVMAAAGDKIVTYNVGNPSSDGTYYVRMDGDDTVYTETGALAQAFQTTLDDLLALETVPQDIDTVTGLDVRTDAGNYALAYRTDAGDIWYTDTWPWFLLDEAGAPVRPLDTERVESLYGLVTDISLADCAAWSGAESPVYGLTEPQGTVTVTYLDDGGEERSFTLEFGSYVNSDVYVRLAGSKMVYRVAGTVLDGLMYPDFDAMAPLAPAALNWERLQSVELALGDDDTYNIMHTLSTPTEAGEEPEDIYTEGDRSLDPELMGNWLRQVYELPADSRVQSGQGRDRVFALVFRQDSQAFPEVTVEFHAYDSGHYLCVVNGGEYYLVSRTAADAVANTADAILNKTE